jgi:hypothetical protein
MRWPSPMFCYDTASGVGVRDVRFKASPEELSRIAFSLRSSWPICLIGITGEDP